MSRKTKPENDTGVSPEAAAARPHRQTAISRARRASAPAAKPVPPAADVDAVVTPDAAPEAATPKPRPKPAAPRTKQTPVKADTAVALPANQKPGKRRVGSSVAEPSREAIAELAYLYWEARRGGDGAADEDWLRAERELRQRAKATA